ncbi:hypothetical protein KKF34_14395 [Myxococcota bacterium]|nr:hypothetical protein [Myxococcota bacterium]MBU1380708.1 hypothetical protein [Myxococcota bacterium]MBU1498064.1 hypothetical protein [Myxococcota bacterium]
MTVEHIDIKVEFVEHNYERFKKTITFDIRPENTSSEPDYLVAVYESGNPELLIELYIGEEAGIQKGVDESGKNWIEILIGK